MPNPNRFKDKSKLTNAPYCATCGQHLSNNFGEYLFLILGNTITCSKCENKNYIIPKGGIIYGLLKLITIGLAIIIAVIIGISLPMETYNAERGEFRVSIGLFFVGITLGIVLARLILKTYNWHFGLSSADKIDQSILDF